MTNKLKCEAIIVLCLVLLAGRVYAVEPVSFDFQSVSVVSVMQLTYKNLLHRDYVISPEVLALDKKISLSVKALPFDDLSQFVDGILADDGVVIKKGNNDVYYVRLAQVSPGSSASVAAAAAESLVSPVQHKDSSDEKASDEVKLFCPMNRNVEFMVTVLNAAFGRSVARAAGQLVSLSGSAVQLSKIEQFAASVDLLPRSVEVSASFVEVSTTSAKSSGLALASRLLAGQVGSVSGTGNSGSFSVTAGSFQLVVDALVADGRFKQVSNSRVVGDESERVSLSVGDETPTIQSTGRDNVGNAVQNIVYRSSGVILDVLPRVLGGGRLQLVVDGQVSSFKSTTTGVSGSPTLSKRQVKTSVTVGDGDVLLIGGLEQSSASSDKSGFSFLPSSWRGVTASDNRSDLILVLSAKTVVVSAGGASSAPVLSR